ncbi:MAG: hypothetical protein COU29_00210 [Candidatus Magasanikbacteria bacterium CG10_big_fil_rev_8_21_14_0_10_36_32]|uniref:Non-canonical purine NTP pyrophosphatase n=1 Tax=Candidatus Magasanikbacteria bacterium CG10_big_fil_rev_8_21_14_0_10_36_32 TaxID=1974646 RepID=A0A2M6W7J8_9BACT|nr:MAG: hypothetical protein COU29_00210 [Candidatus Magasanikbacteria bacterium CG10_big_fil_rev_8_21_14_0_10_36_32]
MKKILIATTNQGKFEEIVAQLKKLPFKFLNLNSIKLKNNTEVDEPYATTWENALHKAKFYAKKTGLLTIAEDTAFCVDYIKGKPGIKAKRFGKTADERNKKILKMLSGVKKSKRQAFFLTHGCIYNPKNNDFHIFQGRVDGVITAKMSDDKLREGMTYDLIFYHLPSNKLLSQMSILQKNKISHRGQLVKQIKEFLKNNY